MLSSLPGHQARSLWVAPGLLALRGHCTLLGGVQTCLGDQVSPTGRVPVEHSADLILPKQAGEHY